MNIKILQVTATAKGRDVGVGIRRSDALVESGFYHGASVLAVPEPDGFTLSLRENDTRCETGKCFRVGIWKNSLKIVLRFSQHFAPAGLSVGDFLAANFEPGRITARKLPPASKYYRVGVGEYNYLPDLRLMGNILTDAGFIPDVIATVSTANDEIFVAIPDEKFDRYADLVKFARANRQQIVQPHQSSAVRIIIPPYLLENVGFSTGDFVGACFDVGKIKLFRADLTQLGF